MEVSAPTLIDSLIDLWIPLLNRLVLALKNLVQQARKDIAKHIPQ